MTHRPDVASVVDAVATRGDSAPIGHLLDMQFWLLGRDVEHPDGNLLVRFGFLREPAAGAPTRYRPEADDERRVLWPCGLLLNTADTATLLLRGRVPADVTGLDPLPLRKLDAVLAAHQAGAECSPVTLGAACAWFARYEASVRTAVGLAHRVPRAAPRPQLAPTDACSLEDAWRELGASYLPEGADLAPAIP